MRSLFLTLFRFSLAAWVGAAGLFVATSVREQVSASFDLATKDQLALLRFPYYYAFGVTLLGIALVSGIVARNHPAVSRRTMRVCLGLATAALAIMLADYFFVYRPLAELIAPPGAERTAEFETYHTASELINELHVSLAFLAALLACLPGRARTAESACTNLERV